MFATFFTLVALTTSPDAVEIAPGAFVVPTGCDADVIVDFNEDLGEPTVWIADGDGVRLLEDDLACTEPLLAAR